MMDFDDDDNPVMRVHLSKLIAAAAKAKARRENNNTNTVETVPATTATGDNASSPTNDLLTDDLCKTLNPDSGDVEDLDDEDEEVDEEEYADEAKCEVPSDEDEGANKAGEKRKKPRGTTFASGEMHLLARAFMEVSENAAKGTDQNGNTFWNSCFASYEKLRVHTNNLNEEVPGWKPLPERTMISLRTQWKRRIQPGVQKFAGICLTNPPASGELKDDPEMDLYYKKMREIYNARSVKWGKNVPKSFDLLMPAFKFLQAHPKFEVHFAPNEDAPPSVRKTVTTKRNAAGGRQARPVGRDKMKTSNTVDFVVHKVSENISKSMNSEPGGSNTKNQPNWDVFTENLVNANRNMEAMVRHQIMSSAPSPQKKKYFEDVMVANTLEAQNKRMKAELEQQQLLIAAERARVELMELQEGCSSCGICRCHERFSSYRVYHQRCYRCGENNRQNTSDNDRDIECKLLLLAWLYSC